MLVLKGPRQSYDAVFFSLSGRGIVVRAYQTGFSTVRYWPTFDTTEPQTFAMKGFGCLGLVANGTHLVATTSGGLTAYPLEGDKGVRWPSTAGVSWFACSPTEPMVVVRHYSATWSGWRIGKNGDWKRLWQEKGKTSDPMFTADGTRVLEWSGAYLDQKTHAYVPSAVVSSDPRTGKRLESTAAPQLYPTRQTITSPDGRFIAQPIASNIVIFARDTQWQLLATVNNGSLKYVTGIAFHPSGRFLAATSNDKTVTLYDTTNWAVAKTFTWDIGKMRSIAFSPDGTLAAAGSDTGKVVIWDVDM